MGRTMAKFGLAALGWSLAILAAPARAQVEEGPYWASIRAEKVNMRVGPAETYPIDWVYRRPQLPLRVMRREEGWRLVEDPDGSRGWVLGRFLARERTAIVIGRGLAAMHVSDEPGSPVEWRLEPGVIGTLGDCEDGWCRLAVGERTGYVRADRLWGDGEP